MEMDVDGEGFSPVMRRSAKGQTIVLQSWFQLESLVYVIPFRSGLSLR